MQGSLTKIEWGMSKPRNPARIANQCNRIAPGQARFGNLGGAILTQIERKCLPIRRHLSGANHPVCQVLAADRGSGEGVTNRLKVDLHTDRRQPSHHRFNAILPSQSLFAGDPDQFGIGFIDKMAENMDFASITLAKNVALARAKASTGGV